MFGCCVARDKNPSDKKKENLLTASNYEKMILETTGMKYEQDFLVYDKKLATVQGHIHTIEAGMTNKQKVVLVHGYGATGVFYYKLINHLRHDFHVFAIDLYGFGQSSRPEIKSFDYDPLCDFFLKPFEDWRNSSGIQDFVLVAHSLGAYLMTQYMRIFKPPVKMLYLVSPAGFTLKTVDEIKDRFKQYVSGFKMLTIKFSFYLMEDLRLSPFHMMFINRDQAIMNYFKHDRMHMSDTECGLFTEYFKGILDLPACGEKALGTFLFYGCYSKRPLCETLKKIRDDICNVRIFYGDADWMDFEHAIDCNERMHIRYDIQMVPNAGHQIILQNPQFLSRVLIDDLDNEYDPHMYFEQEFNQHVKHSYLNVSKDVLQYLAKNATDLTMMK